MVETPDRAFLGSGLSYPFAITTRLGGLGRQSSASTADGIEKIKDSILQILTTTPGERVIRRGFGSGLRGLVFQPLDMSLIQTLELAVRDAIDKWEPRVAIRNVQIGLTNREKGILTVIVEFVVRATNTPGNLVFPYYLTGPDKGVPSVSVEGFLGA